MRIFNLNARPKILMPYCFRFVCFIRLFIVVWTSGYSILFCNCHHYDSCHHSSILSLALMGLRAHATTTIFVVLLQKTRNGKRNTRKGSSASCLACLKNLYRSIPDIYFCSSRTVRFSLYFICTFKL